MYYILLIITAIIAYAIGSLSSMTIASMYVFKKNLRKLGRGNTWLSNFRRLYGVGGMLLLLLVEVIRDLIPILIGGLLLIGKGHSDVGRAFAGFCLIMGRLWPLFYDLKGSHATVCIIVTGFLVDPSVGIAAAAVTLVVLLISKYLSLATVAGAVFSVITAVLVVETKLIVYIMAIIAAVVFVKHIPALGRIVNGTELKISLKSDLGYKFDD